MKYNFYLLNTILLSCISFSGVPDLGNLCVDHFLIKNDLSDHQRDDFNKVIEAGLHPKFLDYMGRTIQNKDWPKLNLKEFNFSHSVLHKIILKDAQLSKAIFNNTTFEDIDFSNTDLKEVNFNHCIFIKCTLKNNDLSQTKFDGSQFKNIDFSNTVLKNVNFMYCKFENVSFEYADLITTQFNESQFIAKNKSPETTVKLEGALLQKGFRFKFSLTGLTWEEDLIQQYSTFITQGKQYEQRELHIVAKGFFKAAKALNKVLCSLYIVSSDLYNLDLTGIHLENLSLVKGKNINFTNAILKNSDFSEGYYSNLNLTGADLQGINLRETTIEDSIFINTDLKGVDLSSTNLIRVQLSENVFIENNNNNPLESFEKWDKGSDEERKVYQKFINACDDIICRASNERLKKVEWAGLDLNNSYLTVGKLKNCQLINVNLSRAFLIYENSEERISDINLQGAQINGLRIITTNDEAPEFFLPNPCSDEDLVELYKKCDQEDKKLVLKELLIAKKIDFEHEEPRTKKQRTE